jgi:transposase
MQTALDLGTAPAEVEGLSAARRKAHVREHQVFRKLSEETLLPSDLRSLIPEEDPCLLIRAGLKLIDLSALREDYFAFGGIAYDPLPMLGILLYAYLEGDLGSRTIESRCRRDVCYMYVGYGQTPDDRTIRRFRRRIGSKLDAIFKLVIEACKESDLLPMGRVAIDGTKIASAASQLSRWITKAEKEDLGQMGLEAPESSDPDARAIKAPKGFILGYNCQAAVDCDSGVVVALDISNKSSDGHLLSPMVEKTVQNVGQVPAQVVADAGYDSSEGAHRCAELGIEPIIAQKDATTTFWSVTEDDEIVCPMGHVAQPAGETEVKGKPYQILKVRGCPECVFFKECCPASGFKSLKVALDCDIIHRMNSAYRARSPEGKLAMRERMAKIEPVFADIKSNIGFNRFVLRGEAGVRIEWTLIHMARNLRILGLALSCLLSAIFQFYMKENDLRNPPRARKMKSCPCA